MTTEEPVTPSRKEAFLFWLKLGFISFGGPAGQISIMHQYLVERKKWISEKRYLQALNYCMLLPGPEAQQLATYLGWLMHGIRGGIIAGFLFVFPSLLIITALSVLYVLYGDLPLSRAILSAVQPAVLAIIAHALWRISKKSLNAWQLWLIAILAFCAIWFFGISYIWILLSVVLIGSLFSLRTNSGKKQEKDVGDQEKEYLINAFSRPKTSPRPAYYILFSLLFLGLWLVPFLILGKSDNSVFWHQQISLYTKSALVTVGGAYSVLPYVAQQVVEHYQWISHTQMMDGLALGESTPGPLIMVLCFFSFLSAYGQSGSILMACLSSFVAAWYTFLPSFYFILMGGPLVERYGTGERFKRILSYCSASVTGVLLNLFLLMTQVSLIDKFEWSVLWFTQLSWMILAFVLLLFNKLSILQLLLISLGLGVVFALLT